MALRREPMSLEAYKSLWWKDQDTLNEGGLRYYNPQYKNFGDPIRYPKDIAAFVTRSYIPNISIEDLQKLTPRGRLAIPPAYDPDTPMYPGQPID